MRTVRTTLWDFFTTWRFPAFVLFVLVFADAFVIGILLLPPSRGAFGAFAEEFRIWCFGLDPATRRIEWSYVGTLFAELIMLSLVVLGVWWRPLHEARRHPRRLSIYALAALMLVGGSAAAFGKTRAVRFNPADIEFPARALRTALPAPLVDLTNQDGQRVTLQGLRGHVVLLTGFYSGCGSTCPMLLRDAREAVASLRDDERARLRVIAVTLDPARDDVAQLGRVANARGMRSPLFHFVTGDPTSVGRALDDLSIARTRDGRTGVIEHANVFVLVDRDGRVAYRLSLGSGRRRWLASALRALLAE